MAATARSNTKGAIHAPRTNHPAVVPAMHSAMASPSTSAAVGNADVSSRAATAMPDWLALELPPQIGSVKARNGLAFFCRFRITP